VVSTSTVASPMETMAVAIARDLRDGEWVEVGAGLPVPRAGALLAHILHGPNMRLMIGMTKAYVRDEPSIEEFEFITDVRGMRWAEAYYQHDQLLSAQKFRRNGVFFCGGIQLDAFGNSNLIGTRDDAGRLTFRGPGGIGTCNATVQNGRYHLVTTSHSPRVLVERCDYVSALGFGDGTPGLREELGLPNRGPTWIITPMCIFDFDPVSHRARLKSLHEGVTVEDVRAKTGFEFDAATEVPTTEIPSDGELHVLRTRVDRHGTLR
jgi:glutaconate CoA-transferase subunit B